MSISMSPYLHSILSPGPVNHSNVDDGISWPHVTLWHHMYLGLVCQLGLGGYGVNG